MISKRSRGAFVLSLSLLSVTFFAFITFPSLVPFIGWSKDPNHRFDADRCLPQSTKPSPANSTLGFGRIYVVSEPLSPRRDRLEQAANITEIRLEFPEQRAWTAEDLQDFRGKPPEESQIGDGSIKAWLSHHVALRAFLESNAETALILEDDVDFDLRIRSRQISLAQQASRQLFSTSPRDSKKYPWGHPSNWDVLWIGHCGDTWVPWGEPRGLGHFHPETLAKVDHMVYADETTARFHELHPWTSSLLASFGVHEKHRVIHKTKFPLCTFAYAVTRRSAQRLLVELAPPQETSDIHAWDVMLLSNCRDKLSCWSLQPELFHHYAGKSAIGKVENNPFISEEAVVGSDNEFFYFHTSNIPCGRNWYDGDLKKLELLKNYARRGECPRDLRS